MQGSGNAAPLGPPGRVRRRREAAPSRTSTTVLEILHGLEGWCGRRQLMTPTPRPPSGSVEQGDGSSVSSAGGRPHGCFQQDKTRSGREVVNGAIQLVDLVRALCVQGMWPELNCSSRSDLNIQSHPSICPPKRYCELSSGASMRPEGAHRHNTSSPAMTSSRGRVRRW